MSEPFGMARASDPASRQALLTAFAGLALSRRYREFGVGSIVGAARVARSTFYYHFRAKDDLLIENLKPLIAALAAMPLTTAPSSELRDWVAHVWAERAFAGRLLEGATGRRIEAAIAAALRENVGALAAEPIAGASLALLRAWIGHRVSASPEAIADALWRAGRAFVSPAA